MARKNKSTLIKICLCLSLILILDAANSFAWDDNAKEAVIRLNDIDQLHQLIDLHPIITFRDGLDVGVYVLDEQLIAIEEAGFDIITIGRAGVAPPTGKDSYLTHGQMTTELAALALANPAITRHWVVGDSVSSKSVDGFLISDNAQENENEPSVLFDCSIHGNEAIANAVCMNFIRHLLAEYGSDQTITDLVDQTQIVFVPMVNPDGNDSGSRLNGNSVDLNRDHPLFYDEDTPGPASQPETVAMVELSMEWNFVNAISFHSGAECVNYLWDSFPHDVPDVLSVETLANAYGLLVSPSFWVTNGWAWYEIHGSSEESYYGINGTIAQIVELSNTYKPPASQIETYAENHRGAMLYWIEAALEGLHGVVRDGVTAQPLEGTIRLNQGDLWPRFSGRLLGDYHAYLAAGNYDVEFIADGYSPFSITSLSVGSTTQDALLSPLGSYSGTAHKVIGNFTDYPDSDSVPITMPHKVLGPVDGQSYSLNTLGWIIVDMGETPIQDITGNDFSVHETGNDESYQVLVSNDWTSGWQPLGTETGNHSFDISSTGLTSARYLIIRDTGADSGTAGADIDAITFDLPCDTPDPDFTADVTVGQPPLTVNFEGFYDSLPGCVLSVNWTFGDGNSSSDGAPSNTYTALGQYTVRLTATGPGGTVYQEKENYIQVVAGDDDDDDHDDDDDDVIYDDDDNFQQADDDDSGGCCG